MISNRYSGIIVRCIFSALLTAFVFGVSLLISGMLPGSPYVFITGDSLDQYIPYIKMFLRHFFAGDSLEYSFELGMGMPTAAVYAYYSLSPFNFPALFIADVNLAAVCITLLKLMAAAAAMSFFVQKVYNDSIFHAVALPQAYVFCGFTVNFYYGIVFFDSIWLFPLIIYAVMRLIRGGEWRKLCVIYTISFVVQFYCAYITGVASFIFFLFYMVYVHGGNRKKWIKAIRMYCLGVFLAVMIAAVVLLPAGMELFRQLGADNTVFSGIRLMPWDFLGGFFPGQYQSTYNTLPMIYTGVVPLMFSCSFFLGSNDNRKKKLLLALLVVLLICFFWGPAYLFMHAFDAPDGYLWRFSWILSFWMVCCAADYSLPKEKEGMIKLVCCALFWSLSYFGLMLLKKHFSGMDEQTMTVSMGVISTVFLLLVGELSARGYKVAVGLLMMVEIIINAYFAFDSLDHRAKEAEYYNIWTEQANNSIDMIRTDQNGSEEFYRVHYLNAPTDNISMLYGFRGVGWFSSIENEQVRKELSKLGYGAASRVLFDYGQTDFTQMLFSQKYSVECGFFGGEHREQYSVTKNEYSLPVAFMSDEKILNWKAEGKNPFEIQESLASSLTGERESIFFEYSGEVLAKPDGISIIPSEDGTNLLKTADKDGEGRLDIVLPQALQGMLVYTSRNADGIIDYKSPLIQSSRDLGTNRIGSRLLMPHILKLGEDENGEYGFTIIMEPGCYNEVSYYDMYFASVNKDALRMVYDKLSAGGIQLDTVRDSEISGRVVVSEGKEVLFSTIPFDSGWHVYVDGDEQEIIPVMEETFCGTRLTPGEHRVIFIYKNGWRMIGLIISVVGIIIMIISTFYSHKKTKKE